MSEPKKEPIDAVAALSNACEQMERDKARLAGAQSELESAERMAAQARERRDVIAGQLAASRSKVKAAARAVASET